MMPHSVCAEEIRDIGLWLQKVLAAPIYVCCPLQEAKTP
jgi:hypothetical protein